MAHRLKLLLVVFWITFLSTQAFAETSLKIHKVDSSKFPEIKVFISAEENGIVVASPDITSFKIVSADENKCAVKKVVSLKASGEKTAIVLAIDTSGSMKDETLLTIKQAIKALIAQKEKDDVAALLTFNDNVTKNALFTKEQKQFLEKLDAVQAGGKNTVLFKAVYEGLELLEQPALPQFRYLVVFSDGKNEGEGFALDDAIAKANKQETPIHTLGFVSKADRKYLDNMVRLAKLTGGEYREVSSDKDIITAYASIADTILKQQMLSLEAGFTGDGKEHRFKIQYLSPNKETGEAEVTMYAPLLKQPRFISGLPNSILYIAGLTIALLAVIVVVLVKKRRSAVPLCGATEPAIPAEDTITPVKEKYREASHIESALILTAPARGIKFPLRNGAMTIGAHPDNTLAIEEDTVSGYHAEIAGNGREWLLKDLGSTNGTKLNGKRITEPVLIHKGDVIHLGRVELQVTASS